MRNKEPGTNKYLLPLFYVCSFVLPVLLYLTVYARGHFWPFGDRSVLVCDLNDQLFPFLTSLRYVNARGNSDYLCWSSSLGGNYYGLHVYYLNSPFNVLTRLFPVMKMPQAIAVLTLLKAGLMGLTFSILSVYFVRKHVGKIDVRLFAFLPLCIGYVFTIYNFKYAMHLMWFDGIILLPLVIMGLERIFDGKKGLLYLCSLTAAFYFNYYTGYMIGLFSALYFIAVLIREFKLSDIKALFIKGVRYASTSLMAILLAFPMLEAVLTDLTRGKLDGGAGNTFNELQFDSFAALFERLLSDSLELPTLRTGWFEAVLVLLFLILPNIKIKEKISIALLHVFMIVSFYYDNLVLMWHCFKYPNDFYVRFQFIYNFLFLITALRALTALFELITIIASKKKVEVTRKIIFAFGFICVLTVFTECLELGKRSLAVMGKLDIKYGYESISEYEDFVLKTKPLTDEILESDEDFYRLNLDYYFTRNDPMIFGYKGLNFFSSTFNRDVNAFLGNVGFAQYSVWVGGYGTNPAIDGLLSVKYSLSENDPGEYYIKGSEQNGVSVYENPHTAGIIYAAPVSTLNPEMEEWNTYGNINSLLDAIDGGDGSGEYFTEIPYVVDTSDGGLRILFEAPSEEPIYMHMVNYANHESLVYVNGEEYVKYFTDDTVHNIYVGSYSAGESVEIEIVSLTGEPVYEPAIRLVELDTVKLASLMDGLRATGINIESYDRGSIKGTIVVPEGCRVMTSIPAEDGWTILLDGEEVSYEKFADTFITFEAVPGEHRIEMSFFSPGLMDHMWVMYLAFVSVIIYLFGNKITGKFGRKQTVPVD